LEAIEIAGFGIRQQYRIGLTSCLMRQACSPKIHDMQRPKQRKQPRGKPFEKGNTVGFQPGQSGNPAGRPRGIRYLSEAYRAWLSQPSEKDQERTNADVVAEAVGKQAIAGDIAAAKEIADRVEGKSRQAIDLNNENERERKTRLYELMVERIIQRMRDEHGETITRAQAIETLAYYQPEIREYVLE
jgi:Family of unknown function (DUF5681)